MSESIKAKRLFVCIGEIDETMLDEAETADIATDTATTRKRYVRYGTLAAAATFGVTVTYLLLRQRRIAAGA